MDKHKLAYYTTFCGSDHNAANRIPPTPSHEYDCYFFTNNKNTFEKLKDTKWIPKFIDIEPTDDLVESSMLSKVLKATPESDISLTKYNYLCYMDSKLTYVNDELVLNIINTKFTNDICFVLREHEVHRGSVWVEYNDAINYQERYRVQSDKYKTYIEKQVENGLSDNVTQPHYQTGFIVRDMTNPKTHKIDKIWHEHIQLCGIECQISFYFVKQLFQENIAKCW